MFAGFPVVAGVAVGVLMRISPGIAAGRWAGLAESVSLKLFLPLFLFEALLAAPADGSLLSAGLGGFAMPVVCLVCGRMMAGFGLAQRPHALALGFLSSSFGGGNRGSAMLALLFVSSPLFGEYLKWFILVDLGNFLALLFVVAPMIQNKFGAPEVAGGRWRALTENYVLVTLAVLAICYCLRMAVPDLQVWLEQSSGWRKFIFSFLVFFAIAAKLAPRTINRAMLSDLAWFGATRLVGAVLLIPLAMLSGVPSYALVAMGILFLMPPSSILPAMVSRSTAPADSKDFVNAFAGGVNLLYIVAIALAALAKPYLACLA